MDTSTSTPAALGRIKIVALSAVILGGLIVIVGVGLGWHGLVGGFALGAGIGLLAVGCYFWGYAGALRKTAARTTWLPSHDVPR